MAAGPDAVWVCQIVPPTAEASGETRLAVMDLHATHARRFRRLPVGALADTIRLAAAREDRLHVFFQSGTHRSFVQSMVEVPAGEGVVVPLIEVDLPDPEVLPTALTSDGRGEALWAVVKRTVAQKIDEAAARRQPAEPVADGEAGIEPPPQRVYETEFVLARYDGLYWSTDRAMPADFTADVADACFLIVDGDSVVAGFDAEAVGEWRTVLSQGAADGWTSLPSVHLGDDERVLVAGVTHGAAALLVTGGAADGRTLRTLTLDGGAWVEGVSMPLEAPAAIESADLRGVLLPELVMIGAIDEQGQVQTAAWSSATGTLAAGFQPVQVFVTAPYAMVRVWLSRVIEFGLLALAIIVVLFRRHDSVAAAMPLPVTLTLAPLSARLSAFVIDAALLAGGGYLALLASGQPVTGAWMEAVWERTRSDVGGKVQLLLFVGLAVAIYGFVFELAMSATPGKRLLGLHVAGPEGARPGAKAVLLRNLLRLVDLQLPPMLILVVMTVNRQRVGDIVARTVVVCPSGRVPQAGVLDEGQGEEAEAEGQEEAAVEEDAEEEVRR